MIALFTAVLLSVYIYILSSKCSVIYHYFLYWYTPVLHFSIIVFYNIIIIINKIFIIIIFIHNDRVLRSYSCKFNALLKHVIRTLAVHLDELQERI